MKKEPSSDPLTMYWALLGQEEQRLEITAQRHSWALADTGHEAATPHTYTAFYVGPLHTQDSYSPSQMAFLKHQPNQLLCVSATDPAIHAGTQGRGFLSPFSTLQTSVSIILGTVSRGREYSAVTHAPVLHPYNAPPTYLPKKLASLMSVVVLQWPQYRNL